jgi:putative N6-adenine-specific DNA methylase
VAKSAPDGHTVLLIPNALAIMPALYRKLPFDPARDFQPVSLLVATELVLVGSTKLPPGGIRELVALAKGKPGSLNFGSTGVANPLHLTVEMFKVAAGIDIVPIPYKGDAPLKETLAAAMLAASGWSQGDGTPANPDGWCAQGVPLYDPCCGSGTIAIEAAHIACNIAPGSMRRFGFEKLVPFQPHVWQGLLENARGQQCAPRAPVFGSDVAFRMVDFAQRNAERAGVAHAVELRGGDALQRMPPSERPGVMLVNPPYGERIEAAGIAGAARRARYAPPTEYVSPYEDVMDDEAPDGARLDTPRFGAREITQTEDGGDFFSQLASHWKKNYPGWTAWMLTPDLKLPGRMRFKESRRVPMWNGPIECRMFRFDLRAGSMRNKSAEGQEPTQP